MADIRHLAIEDTDAIITNFYENLYVHGDKEKPLLDDLTSAEMDKLEKIASQEADEPEAKRLDEKVKEQADVIATNGVDSKEAVDAMS